MMVLSMLNLERTGHLNSQILLFPIVNVMEVSIKCDRKERNIIRFPNDAIGIWNCVLSIERLSFVSES